MNIDESNLTFRLMTIFDDSMTSHDYFLGIILNPYPQIVNDTHFFRFCIEKKTHPYSPHIPLWPK